MTECCENCFYSRQDDPRSRANLGCHRKSPEPYSFYRYYLGELLRDIAWSARTTANITPPTTYDEDIATEATETPHFTGWPEVCCDDWCGEWRAKPGAEP
jgi:hypothetical protein